MASRRVQAWQETIQLSENYPVPAPSTKHTFDSATAWPRKYDTTVIRVVPDDTITCTKSLQEANFNPVALNFSDDEEAGGVVELGSAAQEESLFRQSNYFKTLLQEFYPLCPGECVYSPRVTVFRGAESHGWPLLASPFEVALVACPALKYPCLTDEERFTAEDAELLQVQLETVLQTACRYGHDAVVLGAWGCGVWGGAPAHSAEIFKCVLKKYEGAFREVRFAIIPPPKSNEYVRHENVYDTFCDILG
ncbi:hypothetical protein JKP88DRAFT_181612 [Tribonema minus]|uniref:Microbial-type PARG catalytic domain-containing protein n=1 Tax=Tribonema minus TaxID=303371 RepID=A0A835YYP9_9STRA|nr:hypothetical protein JKP88DRAFT_181612 [Tribonema minus]